MGGEREKEELTLMEAKVYGIIMMSGEESIGIKQIISELGDSDRTGRLVSEQRVHQLIKGIMDKLGKTALIVEDGGDRSRRAVITTKVVQGIRNRWRMWEESYE